MGVAVKMLLGYLDLEWELLNFGLSTIPNSSFLLPCTLKGPSIPSPTWKTQMALSHGAGSNFPVIAWPQPWSSPQMGDLSVAAYLPSKIKMNIGKEVSLDETGSEGRCPETK